MMTPLLGHILCTFIYYATSMYSLFFLNGTATTEIYTLSLHDALPICGVRQGGHPGEQRRRLEDGRPGRTGRGRLARAAQIGRAHVYSSHTVISYAVFCLKKKKNRN